MRNIFKRKKKLNWIEEIPKIKSFKGLYRKCQNCGRFKPNNEFKYCIKCDPF